MAGRVRPRGAGARGAHCPRVFLAHAAQWAALWAQLREARAAGAAADAQRVAMMELLSQSLQQIMADLYPGLNAESGVRDGESAP